jgi:hypothetical protein
MDEGTKSTRRSVIGGVEVATVSKAKSVSQGREERS